MTVAAIAEGEIEMPVSRSAGMALSRLSREAAEKSAKKSPDHLLFNGAASLLVAALIAGGVRWLTSGIVKEETSKNIFGWVFLIVFVVMLYLDPW